MIDAIVASRGRAFSGTFYSTFSGYITRMRGYYGMSKFTAWYSWNPKKYEMQKGPFFDPSSTFNREFPVGWVAIDGDERAVQEIEDEESYKNSLSGNIVAKQLDGGNKQAGVAPKENGTVDTNENAARLRLAASPDTGAVLEKEANSVDHGMKSLEESLINALGFLPSEDEALEVAADGSTIYTVFSTDCGAFQHWQSHLLFFSAMRVKQTGFITRIASGCTDEQKEKVNEWHNEVRKNQRPLVLRYMSALSQHKSLYHV